MTNPNNNGKLSVRILLVEDNRGDVRLTQEVLKDSSVNALLDIVSDGEQAIDFLRKQNGFANAQRPDIILLDLNLPKKGGMEVLKEIKTDKALKKIPVIILTTSDASYDIEKAYDLHANCYIQKPVDFDDFARVIRLVETYWFSAVKLSSE